MSVTRYGPEAEIPGPFRSRYWFHPSAGLDTTGGGRSSDGDGIGNMCDCDFNQDNFCGGPDFTLFIGCFNAATNGDATCEAADMNGDGFVGVPDFTLFIGGFNLV